MTEKDMFAQLGIEEYIGDWVDDPDLYYAKTKVYEDMLLIAENPDNFSFDFGDALTAAAKMYGIDEDTAMGEYIVYHCSAVLDE